MAEDETPPVTEPQAVPETPPGEAEPETFPRAYVEELREEAAGHRVKAQRADELSRRLTVAYAAATGRLADPSDLAYSDELLDDDGMPDQEKIAAAIDALVSRKPHLGRPSGDIGQGFRGEEAPVSLAALLRAGA